MENESRAGAVKLSDITDKQVTVNIMTGRSGSFTLVYKTDDQVIAALDVNINSL